MPLTKINNRSLTGQVTNAQLPSDISSNVPDGSVIQVQHSWSDTKTITNTSANSAAPVCPAQVSITPNSTTNKILIMWYGSWVFGNNNDVGFWLLRNGTSIGASTQTGHNNRALIVETVDDYQTHKPRSSSFQYMDEPASTSALTYTVAGIGIQGTKGSGAFVGGANSNNEEWVWGGTIAQSGGESNTGTFAMIAMEIKA
tara:strand:+ start:1679 stop:2278 length:600 start_codon:yes stop_codon:yes gene_type:complete